MSEQSRENRENDGFSSSDGEFEEQVESWRVKLLPKQVRRENEEHSIEILEKNDKIQQLETVIAEQEKNIIRLEEPERKVKELEEELQEQREENGKLTDELNKTKECFAKYKKDGEYTKSRLQGKVQELNNMKAELKLKTEKLEEKQLENENLKKELNHYLKHSSELNRTNTELLSKIKQLSENNNDSGINNGANMASQQNRDRQNPDRKTSDSLFYKNPDRVQTADSRQTPVKIFQKIRTRAPGHVVPQHLSPFPSPPKKKPKFSREKRWFGWFECTCGRTWTSSYTWTVDGKKQPTQCMNCKKSMLPYQLVSSKYIILMFTISKNQFFVRCLKILPV